MQRARLLSFCALSGLLSCGSETGDHSNLTGAAPPAGKDQRIADIGDPHKTDHPKSLDSVVVSGVTVVAIDNYDETANGKSRGTIYVQDIGSTAAYAGISLFAPTFIPGDLRVGEGDVLDLRGQYQENGNIGSAAFAPGSFLPQLSHPVATFRFEDHPPTPRDIDINDLADFTKGRQWLNMLVRVKNVTLLDDAIGNANSPRISAALAPGQFGACNAAFPKPPTLTNELTDLNPLQLKKGTVLKSVVGVVTFFCNLHISPRTTADIVVQ